jgi:hypothetical protein
MERGKAMTTRTTELLHAANKARLAGEHELANCFLCLLTLGGETPIRPDVPAEKKREDQP